MVHSQGLGQLANCCVKVLLSTLGAKTRRAGRAVRKDEEGRSKGEHRFCRRPNAHCIARCQGQRQWQCCAEAPDTAQRAGVAEAAQITTIQSSPIHSLHFSQPMHTHTYDLQLAAAAAADMRCGSNPILMVSTVYRH